MKNTKTIDGITKRGKRFFLLAIMALLFINCNHERVERPDPLPPTPPVTPPAKNEVDFWLTNGNETVKLQKQNTVLAFGSNSNQYPTIEVNEKSTFQTIDGFGYTLTGGSAAVINSLTSTIKQDLLHELFDSGKNAISVSYLRISIGASDLNEAPFTYDDMAAGQTDENLNNFSLSKDTINVIPLLKEILVINPNIKILGSPWSAPVWMKDNNSLYVGDNSAMSSVKSAYPDKSLYFTEQYTPANGSFGGDLKWHLKNVIIGSMRNWSRNALEWNLANNGYFGPHTLGGCDVCKGAITIQSSSSFTRNVSYYIIAHVSKFVPSGSVRIFSTVTGNLNNVAFKTPAGKKVLVVENEGNTKSAFNIKFIDKRVTTSLDAGRVGTYVW